MKIVPSTEAQLKQLHYLYPEQHKISPFMALIPAREYYFWLNKFTSLFDAISAHIYPINLSQAAKLPVVQCVAKFVGVNTDRLLVPKVFKFGTLSEGTFKYFGYGSKVIPLLDIVAHSLPYPTVRFPMRNYAHSRSTCLGFLAWDCNHPANKHGDKNLINFVDCANPTRLDEIELQDDIKFDGKSYTHFVTTYNYYENDKYQSFLRKLNETRRLVLPLHSPLDNIQKLIGFTHPMWAEVKALDHSPDNKYVFIRTDNGKIFTWDEVMSQPKLQLELEMSDFWLRQEACKTEKALESLNMYWTYGLDYPWLIDKRDNSFIPAFVVDE